ncbi:hypothetical protein PHMEG_00027315 [Phytophthora megakarya]|uniref:Uncharacterized protein n=1 Tax=Phytophthora megakarya TaxID=4795 RepID=A0A225V7N8_9STRA|nr:hypothetical protein PHMEG_00027315 [Phytophthora megakarya]
MAADSATYDTLREIGPGLHRINAASTNVFASTFIAPELTESPRSYLSYNCTSTSALWNLGQDPNVLKLEKLQSIDMNNHIAATIRGVDCRQLLQASVDRVVVGDEFFGVEFGDSPRYFHVVSSHVVNNTEHGNKSTGETCVINLEPATFTQVYLDCRIKFHSTDINNLIQTESIEAAATRRARRNLGSNTFGFVKDSTCKYNCGEEGGVDDIDVDKCWAKTMIAPVNVALKATTGHCLQVNATIAPRVTGLVHQATPRQMMDAVVSWSVKQSKIRRQLRIHFHGIWMKTRWL